MSDLRWSLIVIPNTVHLQSTATDDPQELGSRRDFELQQSGPCAVKHVDQADRQGRWGQSTTD